MTELNKDSNVKNLIDLFNAGIIKYKDVQDTFKVSRDLIKDRLKGIGIQWDNTEKKFTGEATKDDLNKPLLQLFEKQRGNNLPKIRTNQQTNVSTKETKKEPSKQQTKEVTKERIGIIRKRSSFDIDIELMKDLKIKAILNNRTVYEIVETAIRQYIKTLK